MIKKKMLDLPHSLEAEEGVLGSMLISEQVALELTGLMEPEDFHNPSCRTIFEKIKEMNERHMGIDLITFTQYLRDCGELENVGDASYVTHVFTFVPSASNYKYYVEIVKNNRLFRDLIERSEKTIKYAKQGEGYFSADEILSRAQIAFGSMRTFNFEPPKTLSDLAHEKLERLQSGEPDQNIIRTGIAKLDEVSPIRRGNLVVIKAQKKVGKSTLALTILENVCIKDKLPGLYFAMEDPTEQIMDRVMAGISRVPIDKDHVKKMSEGEMERIVGAVKKMSDVNLIVHDNVFDHSTMISKAKKAWIDNPALALIVVDYVQLAKVIVKKGETREREIATMSRDWRQFTLETKVPVILVSQVNADGESRESRTLEQDATAIWALLEDEMEDPFTRVLMVEYQRNGESHVGMPVRFLGNISRVENPSL